MIVAAAPPPAPKPTVVESLSASLTVNMTPTEKANIAAQAKTAGLSMSAWARAKLTA